MAILSTAEQADMLKRVATAVMNGEVVRVSPAYARAMLDVVIALNAVTAKYDALYAQLNTESDVQYAQRCTIEALTAERDELAKSKHALNIAVSAAIQACGELTAERDELATWQRQAPLYEMQNVLDDYKCAGRFDEAAEMMQRWLNEVTP